MPGAGPRLAAPGPWDPVAAHVRVPCQARRPQLPAGAAAPAGPAGPVRGVGVQVVGDLDDDVASLEFRKQVLDGLADITRIRQSPGCLDGLLDRVRTTGMCSASAKSLTARRKRVPIFSMIAGDGTGQPRCWVINDTT